MKIAVREEQFGHLQSGDVKEKAARIVDLINVANLSMGRATHYSSKEEQLQAEISVHRRAFAVDRGLYGACLALPGATDRSMQAGVTALLSNQGANGHMW